MKLARSVWDSGTKKPKSVFATRVETWKYYDRSVLCPVCNEEVVPILLTKQHKYTNSRLAAFCLLGCWPLCFVPLMMSRDKSVRMVCPLCGHNYCTYIENKCDRRPPGCPGKQLPEVLSVAPKFSRAECKSCCRHSGHGLETIQHGDQQEPRHIPSQRVHGGEQHRQALRRRPLSSERPKADCEKIRRHSQLNLPREGVLCPNQVTGVDHCYRAHANQLTNCSPVKFGERYQHAGRHEHVPHHYVQDGATRSRYGRNRDEEMTQDRYEPPYRHGVDEDENGVCAYHFHGQVDRYPVSDCYESRE